MKATIIKGLTVIVKNVGPSPSGHQMLSVEDRDGVVIVRPTTSSINWALSAATKIIERHNLRDDK